MAILGKHTSVDLMQSREKGRETDIGLVIFRQTPDGTHLGETLMQLWTWNDLQGDRIPRPFFEGACDQATLVKLAVAALTMADVEFEVKYGEKEENI